MNFVSKFTIFRWSYGVLLYEIFTMGGIPYPNLKVQQVIQFVSQGNRMKKTREIPLSVYEVMLRCWDENPDQRPNFDEIMIIMIGFQDHADVVSICLCQQQPLEL